jgi:hypothetical protein
MQESESDIAYLQAVLDRSRNAAGSHLASIFTPDATPTARALVEKLDTVFEMHCALVTSACVPLVAPVDGILYRGRIWFGFPGNAVRARLVRRNPNISASYQASDGFAFIVHGRAVEVLESDPQSSDYFECVSGIYTALYGAGWIDWHRRHKRPGDYSGFIEPRRMYAKV